MQAEIITIGDELLRGFVVNTNGPYIAQELASVGWEVGWMTTVGDQEKDIYRALQQAYKRSKLIILTGGLGPTQDDITRNVISEFFQSPLVFRADVNRRIEKRFKDRGFEFPETNRIQAMIVKDAELIYNSIGTAPGMFIEKDDRSVFVLPGVPAEMRAMMTNFILPHIGRINHGMVLKTITLKTADVPESTIAQDLNNFNKEFPDVRLGFQPQKGGVVIRLTAYENSERVCDKKLVEARKAVFERIGQTIYGEGEDSMEGLIAQLLKKKKLTISVAESCTGGLVSHKLTNVPGSSEFFLCGWVTYDNQAKIKQLGIPEETLIKHGAVSSQTAIAMAKGAREKGHSHIGIATTGIAGPDGGSREKPVGLVYWGYADGMKVLSQSKRFTQDRWINKERFSLGVLNFLRKILLERN